MDNYLETEYNLINHPITKYPDQLAEYLIQRYHIRPGAKLVDAGCGRGDFLYAFRRCGLDAVGVDCFQDQFESGRQVIYGGIDLEVDRLPFDDNSVDVLFTKSVMEHLHNPANLLKEAYRVMRGGGIIIAMVPDWHSCMYIYYDDFTHVQPYTATGLKDALMMFRFKNVESETFYQLPSVWKHPALKVVCRGLQLLGPVKKISKNKFYRFSRELILLASGEKV